MVLPLTNDCAVRPTNEAATFLIPAPLHGPGPRAGASRRCRRRAVATSTDAVMKKADPEGRVIGVSILGVSQTAADTPVSVTLRAATE